MKTFTRTIAAALVLAVLAPIASADEPVQGDFDGDGFATILDLCWLEDVVLDVMQGASAPAEADLDGDGFVDVTDVLWFAMFLLPQEKGDLNGDGSIDIADIQFWFTILQSGCGYYGAADMNDDGIVNVADVQLLIILVLDTSTRR